MRGVVTVGTSDTTNMWVPAYLAAQMPNGFKNAAGAYVPDWNSSAYMTRAEALVAKLGAQFNIDPRMGWFEVSPYGNWGEWHVDDPGDLGGPVMTDTNQVALVNTAVAAFHRANESSSTRGAWEDTAVAALLAGLPQIGWRQDCIGTSTFTAQWTMGGTLVADRWMTAPVMGEFCGSTPGDGSYSMGLTQVVQGHIAMGAGNMGPYAGFSATEQSEVRQLNQLEGYRLVIDSVQLPGSIPAGNSFSVSTNWSNVNVTPAYDAWRHVTFELPLHPCHSAQRSGRGSPSVNLETLMPTTNSNIRRRHPRDDLGLLRHPLGASPTRHLRPGGRGERSGQLLCAVGARHRGAAVRRQRLSSGHVGESDERHA